MMKRLIAFTLIPVCLFSLGGCMRQVQKADTIEPMKSFLTKDYKGIEWQGGHYLPYTVVDKSDMTLWIGIVDGDEKDRVYTYKEYSEKEWLINCYESGLMDAPMLYREEHVTDIPADLRSEYEWNEEG